MRALTDSAKDRNTALFSAAELLKKDARVRENEVEIIWDARVVRVLNEEAFNQPKGKGLGMFTSKFLYLLL